MHQSFQIVVRGISGILALSAIAGLTACGGGGGGGDDDVPSECRSYCRTACAKVGVCVGGTEKEIEECRTTCIRVIEEDGTANPQSCQNASAFVLNASCSELGNIIGFRTIDGSQLRMSQEVAPDDCGETLGLLSIDAERNE